MSESRTHAKTKWIRLIAGNILVFVLILLLLEGGSSYLLVLFNSLMARPVAERLHTQYDPELGWVNKPNINMPNMYGQGISLKTNSQRFRADHDFDVAVPHGKYRAICSGDSFTLGYGVSDDHAWCQLLTKLDPQLETVNMGQAGYGLDQTYLWYKRDGLKFEHQIHLLAFITEDFKRMQSDKYIGYSKPFLDIENGSLVVRNVPVPRRAYQAPWLTTTIEQLEHLRTIEFLNRLSLRLRESSGNSDEISLKDKIRKTREIVSKILEDLKRQDDAQSRRLVMVYLPLKSEMKGDDPQEWIKFLKTESKALGIPLINVLESFRNLPDGEAEEMFIPEGQLGYRGAAGHLNNQGNQLVADIIYKSLREEK